MKATAARKPVGPLWFWVAALWEPCCYAIKTTANSKPGDTDVHCQLTAVLGTQVFDILGNASSWAVSSATQVDQRAVFFSIYLNVALITSLGIVRSSEIRPAPTSRLRLCSADPLRCHPGFLCCCPRGWAEKTHTHLPAAKLFMAPPKPSQKGIQWWHQKEHWWETQSLGSGLGCATTNLNDLGEVQSLLRSSKRLGWANTDGYKHRIWEVCSGSGPLKKVCPALF